MLFGKKLKLCYDEVGLCRRNKFYNIWKNANNCSDYKQYYK